MFTSVLYSCESWGDITDKLLQIERNALKICLGVKLGTTGRYCILRIKRTRYKISNYSKAI